MLTYDPRNNEDLHPRERRCGCAEEQQGVRLEPSVGVMLMVVGHVRQQGGAGESVGSIQYQKSQENSER